MIDGRFDRFRPWTGHGFRTVCDAVRCRTPVETDWVSPLDQRIDKFSRGRISLAACLLRWSSWNSKRPVSSPAFPRSKSPGRISHAVRPGLANFRSAPLEWVPGRHWPSAAYRAPSMRRFTLVLNSLVAATLCGVSVAGAADYSVPAPRHYVSAQESRYPWVLACPTRQCWVWHDYAWDPEYNNEIGHFRGVPPPPPPPPADEWAGFLAPNDLWRY
jgi:hypothetical protein